MTDTQGSSGPPVQSHRKQGYVKWFNKRRGFGFITDVDKKEDEYFCHHSAISPTTNCWRILHEGEYVEFDVENGKHGFQCVNVTGLRGGPLRCDIVVDKSRNRPMDTSQGNHENMRTSRVCHPCPNERETKSACSGGHES